MHTPHLGIIKLLLQHTADPNIRNDRGLTAYEAARYQAGDTPGTERYQERMAAAELLLATIRQRAEEGDAASQYMLAEFHDQGLGVPQERKAAFHGFERSARNGYRLALV